MSNRNDNDFDFDDDDLFGDDLGSFDFDDDNELPADLGDDFDQDMPVIEEEAEERGPNRTFVVLAGLLIVLFIAGLGAVLFIATRPTGPTDTELTITAVVMANLTVEAYGAQTQTQSAENLAMTQTAAAWTPTPTETLTPSPTEPRPTITPTPTTDETMMAETLNAILALTAAAQPTVTPTTPPSNVTSLDLNVVEAFETQVAFATQQGVFNQSAYATQVAFATEIGGVGLNPDAESALRQGLNATQAALDAQVESVQQAIAVVDRALETAAAEDPFIATQLADMIPIGGATQTALAGQSNVATDVAAGTLQAIGTEIFNATATASASASVTDRQAVLMQIPVNAKAAFSSNPRSALQQIDPTAQAFGTLQAQATLSAQTAQDQMATQVAQGADIRGVIQLATQNALDVQASFATLSANITQAALGTAAAQGTDVSEAAAAATATGEALSALLAAQAAVATQASQIIEEVPTQEGVEGSGDQVIDSLATLIAAQTQAAFATPPVFATQAAVATQAALATREALIQRLQGTLPVELTPTSDPLLAVNQTATAIAGAFLTATAQAGAGELPTQEIGPTQGFPTVMPTALPDTGLFDDIAGGGRDGIGWLALAVIGLVGVIVVSRRLRSSNAVAEEAEAPPAE